MSVPEELSISERYSLSVLEYSTIIRKLAGCTQSSLGYALAENLEPSSDLAEISRRLDYADDARRFLDRESVIPTFQGMSDIREQLARAAKSGILSASELYKVNATLKAIRTVRRTIKEANFEYPHISREAMQLGLFPEIEDALDLAIHPDGEVMDRASDNLRRIRRELNIERERAEKTLAEMISKYSRHGFLREANFTIKNGRYVLPFRQDCQKNVPSVVQARSSSGGTVFVEPYELVERNNRLSELRGEEEAEVTRILGELSALVGSRSDEIRATLNTSAFLDFIFATGRLSREWKASRVQISNRINLKGARHPMIPYHEVVPVDISFPDDVRALIISGPNAGGKTVALKTIGLFALLNQAGLHVPVREGSQLPVFGSVHADIGDLQSIEWNLSSFSAHIVFLKRMLESLERPEHLPALILLDEIGRSTDPHEGSALSLSVIEKLLLYDCYTAVTTHLPAIKNLILTEKSKVAGASVEFDIEKAQPLYTIRTGTLGASYAVAIARRLGLDSEILKRAEEFLVEKGDLLAVDIPGLEHRLEELEQEVRRMEKVRESTNRNLSMLIAMERLIILAALQEAEKVASEAEKKLEEARKLASALPHQIDAEVVNETLAKIREWTNKLRKAADAIAAPMIVNAGGSSDEVTDERSPGKLEIGNQVWILSLRREGELVDIGPKSATVVIGGKRLKVHVDELKPVDSKKEAIKTEASKTRTPAPRNLPLFIDLHGLTVEEAVQKLDPYLDEAYYQGREQAHVVHGFGTGALRKGIHEHLKKHPLVQKFEFAEPDQGGAGVTVVTFKRGK